MRLHGLAALAAGLLLAQKLAAVADRPDRTRPPSAGQELKRFQGVWHTVRVEEEGWRAVFDEKNPGKACDRPPGYHVLTFRSNKVTIREDGDEDRKNFTCTLAPSRAPKALDLRGHGKGGMRFRGIYRFSRGKLILLLAKPENQRPVKFSSPPARGQYLLVLARLRPPPKKPAPRRPAKQPKAKPGAPGRKK